MTALQIVSAHADLNLDALNGAVADDALTNVYFALCGTQQGIFTAPLAEFPFAHANVETAAHLLRLTVYVLDEHLTRYGTEPMRSAELTLRHPHIVGPVRRLLGYRGTRVGEAASLT